VQKASDFLNFMVCPHRQGEGVSQCGYFVDKGDGQFYRFLPGRLLWTIYHFDFSHKNAYVIALHQHIKS